MAGPGVPAELRRGGELKVEYPTVEGDPITAYYRVTPDGGTETYEDSTEDPFGSQEWSFVSCPTPAGAQDVASEHRWGAAPDVRGGRPTAQLLHRSRTGLPTGQGAPSCPASSSSARSRVRAPSPTRSRAHRPHVPRRRRLAGCPLHVGHQLRRRRQDLLRPRGRGRRHRPRAHPSLGLPGHTVSRRWRTSSDRTPPLQCPPVTTARRNAVTGGGRSGRGTSGLGVHADAPYAERVVLLEREHELDVLNRAVAGVGAGDGSAVALSGDSGTGKTALVEAALAGRDGLRVLRGRCDPLATPRPLGPFRDIAAAAGSPRWSGRTSRWRTSASRCTARSRASRRCSSWRTSTGSTPRRSRCCGSWSAGWSHCRSRSCSPTATWRSARGTRRVPCSARSPAPSRPSPSLSHRCRSTP